MNQNLINWFRLENWHELQFEYRLVKVTVDGLKETDKLWHQHFYAAVNFLVFDTKGPAAVIYKDGNRYVAITGTAPLSKNTIAGCPLPIKLEIMGSPLIENATSFSAENMDMANQFVESSLRYQLKGRPHLWEANANMLLRRTPLRLPRELETEIYTGFKFKLVHLGKDDVFVCIDMAYRYTDSIMLHQRLRQVPKENWQQIFSNKNVLYQNGNSWYPVKVQSFGGPISRHIFSMNGKDVLLLDYITKESIYARSQNRLFLDYQCPTLLHTYTNNSKVSFAGASCLAKLIKKTDDESARGIHRNSIQNPNTRFHYLEKMIAHNFDQLSFNNKRLVFSTKPFEHKLKIFSIPNLMYGNNKVLDPYQSDKRYGQPLDHYPKRRKKFVFDYQIADSSLFPPEHIFVPEDLGLSFGHAVRFQLENQLKRMASQFKGFQVHLYPVMDYPLATKHFDGIKKIISEKKLQGGNAILILPDHKEGFDRMSKDLHDVVKKELFKSMLFKCMSAANLLGFFNHGYDHARNERYWLKEQTSREAQSYFSYTAFEVLIINKRWAYTFEKDLKYDVYVGIDAHDFFAGFVFFFRNGKRIVFKVEEIAKKTGSFRNEKILAATIEKILTEVLEINLPSLGKKTNGIVLLRDGVSYGEEEKALSATIEKLAAKGLVEKEKVKTGVVNVTKTSAVPLRAAEISANLRSLENPMTGTFFPMSDGKEGFIFNTGYPFKVNGSSNPVNIKLIHGDVDFVLLAEDVFDLTQLAFSAPDRPNSLPLPLKLIDTLIRDVAHKNNYVNLQQKEHQYEDEKID